MNLATTVGEAAETVGAGAVAVVAVLAPVLAGRPRRSSCSSGTS
ncbi:hypothetical protein SGLAM104S_09574 [Streptomyces glaucescens]